MLPRIVLTIVMTIVTAQLIQYCVADRCKKKIETNYFDRCKLRSKRTTKPLLDSFAGYPSEPIHEHAVKRQIMSIRQIIVASRMSTYPNFPRHEDTPEVPPSDDNIFRARTPTIGSLPQESHSEIGFEMSYEEMIELFDEFYERMPRGTKSRAEIWAMIEQCCRNIDHCKKIDCPYSN